MDKRLVKRLFTRIKVDYGLTSYDFNGFALNLSSQGMFLSGRKLFPPKTHIIAKLLPVNAEVILLQGVIQWAKQIPPKLAQLINQGMGVQFNPPFQKYLDFFSGLIKAYPSLRQQPRIETKLEVRFYNREDFLQEYTENISQGGLFIVSEAQIEKNSILEINVIIPDMAVNLVVKGRVVYLLDKTRAAELNCKPGIGVQILEFEGDTRKVFKTYVDKLISYYEKQGS